MRLLCRISTLLDWLSVVTIFTAVSVTTRLRQEDAENDGSVAGDEETRTCEPGVDTEQSSVEILSVLKNTEMNPTKYIDKKDETVSQGNDYLFLQTYD